MPPKYSRAETIQGQRTAIKQGKKIHPSIKLRTKLTASQLTYNKDGKVVPVAMQKRGRKLHRQMKKQGKLASPFKKKRSSKKKKKGSKKK